MIFEIYFIDFFFEHSRYRCHFIHNSDEINMAAGGNNGGGNNNNNNANANINGTNDSNGQTSIIGQGMTVNTPKVGY